MDKNVKVMELERLEALIASWVGRKVMVRVPLAGTAQLAFYGDLKHQFDNDCDPQFLINRPEIPSPTLVFYIKDVACIKDPDKTTPQIILKSLVDIQQPIE
jgi:hypothetical protein